MNESDVRCDGGPERRAHILWQLGLLGFLSITDLARDLRVSPMTVRRDLHSLASAGEIRLVHGGATVAPGTPHAAGCPHDSMSVTRARLAALALALIEPGDSIAIDAGPTAHALAAALPASFGGAVITHSLPVLQMLAACSSGARVVALGGELSTDRNAFVGPHTEAALARLRARTFFLDPAAVDVRGIYAVSSAEAGVQSGLMDIADEVVLLATADVVGGSAPALVGRLDRLARFVTDRPLPERLASTLHRAGVALHVDRALPPTR